jgi:hypothetical protein
MLSYTLNYKHLSTQDTAVSYVYCWKVNKIVPGYLKNYKHDNG